MGTLAITQSGKDTAPVTFKPNGFNYGTLELSVAKTAKTAVASILKQQTSAQKSLIQVGRELTSVKALLKHGQFLDWIRCEFGMEPRTAQRYMGVAERLGDNEDLLSQIPARVQYALAAPSTPVSFVQKIIADLEQGNDLPPNVMTDIALAKSAALTEKYKEKEQKAKLAGLSPAQVQRTKLAQEAYAKKKAAKFAAAEAEMQAKIKARKQATDEAILDAVAILEAHLPTSVWNDFGAKCKAAGWTQLAEYMGTVDA